MSRFLTNFRVMRQITNGKISDYKTIYKFSYVNSARLINRLKFYQTILTSISLPATTILNQFNVLAFDNVVFTAAVGIVGLVPLYSLGYFCHKMVGFVYFNEKASIVKFAYLDFWGQRKDLEVPLKEIVPFSEMAASFTDPLYLKVSQFSSKETLKLCPKFGVMDQVGFNKVFLS